MSTIKATPKQLNLLRQISPLKEEELINLSLQEADEKIKYYLKEKREYEQGRMEYEFDKFLRNQMPRI